MQREEASDPVAIGTVKGRRLKNERNREGKMIY